MKKRIYNINTWLPCFPGFYNTFLEPDETSEIEYINQEREVKGLPPLDYDDFQFVYDEYYKQVAVNSVNYISKILEDLGVITELVFEEIISPKYYNFSTDSVNIICRLSAANNKAIRHYINDNWEAFAKYIHDKYTSCSGFISFYSNDPEEWINDKDLLTDKHKLGSVLQFIVKSSGEFNDESYFDRALTDAYIYANNYNELINGEE